MALFQSFGYAYISCTKKVLMASLVAMVIVFFIMNERIKSNISGIKTFLHSPVHGGRFENEKSLAAVGLDTSVSPNHRLSKTQTLGTIELRNEKNMKSDQNKGLSLGTVESRNKKDMTFDNENRTGVHPQSPSDVVSSHSPVSKTQNVTDRQNEDKLQNKKMDKLKNAETRTKSPILNKASRLFSIEEYYNDLWNILPYESDPVKASKVSWVTFLSPLEKDKVYKEYAKIGIESTELHSFKSPYVIDPRIYRTPESSNATKVVEASQVKTKIISCYACNNWYRIISTLDHFRKKCPYCQLDIEGKMMAEAEAVIFFPSILGERPVPKRPMGQIWIMAEWECPKLFNYPPSYEQWKSVFNWTFTYRIDSDVFSPTNHLAWRNRDLLLSDDEYLTIAEAKTKMAAWFVSNCRPRTQSRRMAYVKELQKYIDIDIYGKCGTKKCHSDRDCEKLLTKKYKFYLSFENSFCKDYVTEKLFRSYALRNHVILVTRGGFEYHKYIPPGGYVDAADFKSPKELGLFLKELGNDVKRYAEMLKEKDRLKSVGYGYEYCDVCEKLHTRSASENKIIPDIKYWSHHDTCFDPPGW